MPEILGRAICEQDEMSKDDIDHSEEMKKQMESLRESLSKPILKSNRKTNDEIKKDFEGYLDIVQSQSQLMEAVSAQYSTLAQALNTILPESRHKSLALTELENSLLWAIRSLTHDYK